MMHCREVRLAVSETQRDAGVALSGLVTVVVLFLFCACYILYILY